MIRNRAKESDLVGKHLVKTVQIDTDCLVFYCSDGSVYEMKHDQDCCESVYLEDFCGDINDLCDADIHEFRVDTSTDVDHKDDDECQWTFYNIRTSKGYVTLRWYGSSNGYYSVDVDFYVVKAPHHMFKPFSENVELSPYESFDYEHYKSGCAFNVSMILKNGDQKLFADCKRVFYNESSDMVHIWNKNDVKNTTKTELIDYLYITYSIK